MKRFTVMMILAFAVAVGGRAEADQPAAFRQTERGACVETERYKAVFRNGLLVSLFNKLTQEEYCSRYARPERIQPHLPGGLGTQGHNNTNMLARSFELFNWPWWEHNPESTWVNMHYADDASAFEFVDNAGKSCLIRYKNLTDGSSRYPDDTFAVELAVDSQTGDLLVTPAAESKTPGVYSAAFTSTALGSGVTIEAPIMDGIRLGADMWPNLWHNAWPGWWQYGFIALNGWKEGAFGVWCQDAECRVYKSLFYLINEQGLSFSLAALNVPPFDTQTFARPMTWRVQAFSKGWSEAAARYRDWREKDGNIPPRPEWTKHISCIANEAKPGAGEIRALESFLGPDYPRDRLLLWACNVRRTGFDKNHSDNTPYDGFTNDMKRLHAAGLKAMIYLQPMLMWKSGAAHNFGGLTADDVKKQGERSLEGFEAQHASRTIFPFRDPQPRTYEENMAAKVKGGLDQSHLGSLRWQKWFFEWVRQYNDEWGADGIFYDQTYHCPIDSRGLIDGATSPQGMADWFRKSQLNHPGAAFSTELSSEVNSKGNAFGYANPSTWSTIRSFRGYRIEHASPITSALQYPYTVLFNGENLFGGNCQNWIQDLHERRAQIPGVHFTWAGTIMGVNDKSALQSLSWLLWKQTDTFVRFGLRPVFPLDWDPVVLSYYRGAKGEDFRYVKKSWGTAFVQVAEGRETTIFARAHGGASVPCEAGAISEWPLCSARTPYDEPSQCGLDPEEYYVLKPGVTPPAFRFELKGDLALGLLDRCVQEGFSAAGLICMDLAVLKCLKSNGSMTVSGSFTEPPAAVFIDGQASPLGEGAARSQSGFGAVGQRYFCALAREPVTDLGLLAETLVARGGAACGTEATTAAVREYQAAMKKNPNAGKQVVWRGHEVAFTELYLPVRVPEDMPKGSQILVVYEALELHPSQLPAFRKVSFRKNYVPVDAWCVSASEVKNPEREFKLACRLPVKAGEVLLVSLHGVSGGGSQSVHCDWVKPEAKTVNSAPATPAPKAPQD